MYKPKPILALQDLFIFDQSETGFEAFDRVDLSQRWLKNFSTFIPKTLIEHRKDSKDIPEVQFNSPDDVITNDFPLFRPPEMENNGYKEIEDYVDYDVYGMIGARSKKLPNGDKDWFTAIGNGLVTGIHRTAT